MEERAKDIALHRKGYEFCKSLINKDKINYESDWSFEAEDENKIIAEFDFETFTLCHLAYDPEGNPDAKSTWKFPVAKIDSDGELKVFRRGVIAAKQRASQFGYEDIYNAASKLLEMIDEKAEKEMEDEERGISERNEVKINGHYERTMYFLRENEDGDTYEISISSDEPVFRGYYYEILRHDEGAIDDTYLQYGINVLFAHDPNQIIGVTEGWFVKDGKLRVRFKFSKTKKEFEEMFTEGVLRHVSIGYIVLRAEKIAEKDGFPVIQVSRWRPVEFSFVAVPADVSVGVGRAIEVEDKGDKYVYINNVNNKKEVEKMEELKNTVEVKGFELTEKEQKQYSLHRAIKAAAEGRLDGFEREVAEELAKRTGREVTDTSFLAPTQIVSRAALSAPGLVETKFGGLEEGLRSALVIAKAGAQVIEGLTGNVQFALESTQPTLNWINLSSPSPTESSAVIAAITASPKTATIYQPVPKSLLKQTSQDVEEYLRRLFLAELKEGIEAAALVGSGTNGEPTGLANTSGINNINHSNAVITRAALMSALQYVKGNAVENAAWILNGKLWSVLRQIPVQSGYPVFLIQDEMIEGYPVFVTNVIPNTGSAPEVSQIFLGDFTKMIVCVWDAFEIVVDPYTQASRGFIVVNLNAFVDIVVTKPAAFVKIYNVKTATS